MTTTIWSLSGLSCEMSIRRYDGRSVGSKTKPVQLQAIGRDRLQFISDLKLPAQERLLLGIRLQFRDQAAFGEGHIAEAAAIPRGEGFRYTVALTPGSLQDVRWNETVARMASALHEQYEKAERHYMRWQRSDSCDRSFNAIV
jgi:hypothetical protein